MKPHFILLFAATAIVGCHRNPPSPRTFVEQVYAAETGYRENALREDDEAEKYYSSGLLRLINQNDARSGSNSYVLLNEEPLCACEDPSAMRVESITITKQSPTQATAAVTLHLEKYDNRTLQLHLVLLPQGWRIDDISTHDTPSLRKALQ